MKAHDPTVICVTTSAAKAHMNTERSRRVDRASALAIAAEHLAGADAQQHLPDLEGLKIVDGDADRWPFRPPTACYNAPPDFPRGCWVIYVEREPVVIMSSQIIGVSKTTGEVVYSGSANDEG